MISWLKTLLSQEDGVSPRSSNGSPSGQASRSHLIDSLDQLIKTPGKACYQTLTQLAASTSKDEFINFVHCPALVGSAVRDGQLIQEIDPSGRRKLTQLFTPSLVNLFVKGGSIQQSIFLLRKPLAGQSSLSMKLFRIGREASSDLLMVDFAISREHAVIELEDDGYHLQDLASSNGSFVNGNRLGKDSVRLEEGDSIRFARYEFLFLGAGDLYELLKGLASS